MQNFGISTNFDKKEYSLFSLLIHKKWMKNEKIQILDVRRHTTHSIPPSASFLRLFIVSKYVRVLIVAEIPIT